MVGRAPHGPETRGRAIALMMTGHTLHDVSRQLGVARPTLRRWRTWAMHEGLWPRLFLGDILVNVGKERIIQ